MCSPFIRHARLPFDTDSSAKFGRTLRKVNLRVRELSYELGHMKFIKVMLKNVSFGLRSKARKS